MRLPMNILSRLEFYVDFLRTDALGFVLYAVYTAVTVLLSLILHEVSHGYIALRCGDPTAKWLGRLSLDPRKHLDPVGTALMFLFGFGWAKPVPVNPRNFRNYRRDDFLVSVAGICMNLTLFILFTALSVILVRPLWGSEMIAAFQKEHAMQDLLNLYSNGEYSFYGAAVATMYGAGTREALAELAQTPWLLYVERFAMLMAQINLSLAVFNLLPIPPLDGYHLANDLLLKGRVQLNAQTSRIAQFALMAVAFSGLLTRVLTAVNTAVYSAVLNLFLMIGGLA